MKNLWTRGPGFETSMAERRYKSLVYVKSVTGAMSSKFPSKLYL